MAAPLDPADAMRRNRVLALLDEDTLQALATELEYVPLKLRDLLLTEARPVRHVHFPVDGVCSLLAAIEGAGKKIEVGTIGNEGMVGLPLFLGAAHAPGNCFVQVEGAAWRMTGAAFMGAVQERPAMQAALHRYAQALFVQISQSTACNRVHAPLERCARWLLMTGDRVDGETFNMTQEFLAQMLGERRPTVSRVASQLQQRGLIAYSRGTMRILDRPRLEALACPCYALIRSQYDTLLSTRPARRK